MKRTRIAIASILKPVDETRMYKKIGHSLAEYGYEVHIAGYKGNLAPNDVKVYPLFDFNRLSLRRITAPWKILKWLIKIKPKLIIITTHELLLPAIIFKAFSRAKIIYDVQENYFLNINRTEAFPQIIRGTIASYVRVKEQLLSRYIDHFFLAEIGYRKELQFIKNKYTILENKSVNFSSDSPKKDHKKKEEIRLLFSGTLAETTGVFHCIEMAKKLYQQNSAVRLQVIGYCQVPGTYKKLKKIVAENPWISLSGGDKAISHNKVIKAIKNADAGFVFYPDTLLIENTIPTKFYEYLAGQIVLLIQDKKEWLHIAQTYPAAIIIDPENFNPSDILSQLVNRVFYEIQPGLEVQWKGEANKMIEITHRILS